MVGGRTGTSRRTPDTSPTTRCPAACPPGHASLPGGDHHFRRADSTGGRWLGWPEASLARSGRTGFPPYAHEPWAGRMRVNGQEEPAQSGTPGGMRRRPAAERDTPGCLSPPCRARSHGPQGRRAATGPEGGYWTGVGYWTGGRPSAWTLAAQAPSGQRARLPRTVRRGKTGVRPVAPTTRHTTGPALHEPLSQPHPSGITMPVHPAADRPPHSTAGRGDPSGRADSALLRGQPSVLHRPDTRLEPAARAEAFHEVAGDPPGRTR